MSFWKSLAGFVFRTRLRRAKLIESYLCRFTNDEISYMLSLIITGLAFGNHSRDPFDDLDLAAYLYSEAVAGGDTLEEVSASKIKARGPYRVALAKAVQSIAFKRSGGGFLALHDFKLPHAEFTSQDEDRLGLHLTMLTRIYKVGSDAPLLPELEEYGEGEQWASFWRDPN